MSYKATTEEYVFRVTHKEALLETLNDQISELRPPEYPYENLEDALEFFCCSQIRSPLIPKDMLMDFWSIT